MELKQKLFGQNAEMQNFSDYMDDRACEELKARYIAQGIIKPSPMVYGPRERPHMTDHAHKLLKQRLIDQGFLQLKGTINDAFQERSAQAQNVGASAEGNNFPKDLRRNGGGNPQREAPRATRPVPKESTAIPSGRFVH